MKKLCKRILSVILSLIMMISVLPLAGLDIGIKAEAKTISEYKTGDIIKFGSYPQSEVTDKTLLSNLNKQKLDWISYGYYSGNGEYGSMVQGDWMKYADVEYSGNKYRAVTFSQYRPNHTGNTSSADFSSQDDNGYNTNTIYWFKYEPLEWRVLDAKEGLIMCENIIDSQAYSNTEHINIKEIDRYAYYNNSSFTNYANDYATSSIREWLNEDFYNTAFTTAEKNEIKKSVQDNSCCRGSYPEFDSATTNDKIFLLSYDEVRKAEYGFSSSDDVDKAREARGTDYARCQGLYAWESSGTSYDGNSYWRLRSPDYHSAYVCVVYANGDVCRSYWSSTSTSYGVRPAMRINLLSDGTSTFYENSYIADIWLNLDNKSKTENEAIEYLMSYEPVSEFIHEDLKSNTWFQIGLVGWEGLRVTFDPVKAMDDMSLSKSEIYETLIFDLLEKVMSEKGKNANNVILSAIDKTGVAAKEVTKYKKIADGIVDIVDNPTEQLLEKLKDWKTNPKSESYKNFYEKLSVMEETTDKWEDSEFIKGVGDIANAASDVADFYEKFVCYMMATDMANEMEILLKEMLNQTSDTFFRTALLSVLECVENENFVDFVCGFNLTKDITVNFASAVFDECAKMSVTYSTLKYAYEAGTTVTNLFLNTTDSIDAYYLAEATNKFFNANQKAVKALAEKYKSSGNDADAGAYVYAVHTFEEVIAIDLESSANFIKKSTDEGLVNKGKKFVFKAWNWICGNDAKTTFEGFCESKENIIKNIRQIYYAIDNSWKFVHLKDDYPEIHKIYVKEEISRDNYKPNIISAYVDTDGVPKFEWSIPYSYHDDEGNEYALFTGLLDGLKLTQTTTDISERYSFATIERPIQFKKSKPADVYDVYSLSGYSEFENDEYSYTPAETVKVNSPIEKVVLGVPFVGEYFKRSEEIPGIIISIRDSSNMRYDDIKYNVYRKTDSSDWILLKTINRSQQYNGITVFVDETAVDDVEYSYKVNSSYKFGNGKVETSPFSAIIKVSKNAHGSEITEFDLKAVLRNPRDGSKPMPSKLVNADEVTGVELSWNTLDGASKYEIYRLASYGTIYQLIATVDGNTGTYFDDTIKSGITYNYVVMPLVETDDIKSYDLNAFAQGEITCEEAEVEAITISIVNMPTKTEYKIGETLDTTGLRLNVVYEDGTTKTVTGGFECSPTKFDSVGTKTVNVVYGGATCSFEVTVKEVSTPVKTYTLYYDANGGSGAPAPQTGDVTYTISSIKPTRNGYVFLGWSEKSTAKYVDCEPGYSFTLRRDTTLYAVWEEIRCVLNTNKMALNYKSIEKIEPTLSNGNIYSVEFDSSDNSIAMVDVKGNVIATGVGVAEITVTVTDEKGNILHNKCTVTVSYAWWQWLIIIFLFGWIWY